MPSEANESVWSVLTEKPSIPKFIEWCVTEMDWDKEYNKSQMAEEAPVGATTVNRYTDLLVEYNILLESDGRISLYQVNEYSTVISCIERMNEIQPSSR